MEVRLKEPPRCFKVGVKKDISIRHCADIKLEFDEQVTFVTPSGTEYDVVRKPWGYYATSSINGRLQKHGLRGVLVKNQADKFYLLLVEKNKEQDFQQYVIFEKQEVICWLDKPPEDGFLVETTLKSSRQCPVCVGKQWDVTFVYEAAPIGETRFLANHEYKRRILQCKNCGHFINDISIDLNTFYKSKYVDHTYGSDLLTSYNRIMALPRSKSDNYHRVIRVDRFLKRHLGRKRNNSTPPSVLDIGSGLCVFLAGMKKKGWECTALDPDFRAAEHARRNVMIKAVCEDYFTCKITDMFNLITFNKVLEHVADPVVMLQKCKKNLKSDGIVYVEVPDGQGAVKEGENREEFFIEHLHVFSISSLCLVAFRAGFLILEAKRIREPSGKFTLYAFLLQKE